MEKINIVNNVPGLKVVVNGESDGSYVVSISKENQKHLGDFACGSVVKIGGREYIVLEQTSDNTTAVITKNFAKEMAFGGKGDWSESDIRKYLQGEFYSELAKVVGKENIVRRGVDMAADDGSGKGLVCEDFISLMTCNQYRAYREYLPAYGRAWWLATRVTHEVKDYARCVCFVGSSGILDWDDCDYRCGVRPFCFLNSSIFVDA